MSSSNDTVQIIYVSLEKEYLFALKFKQSQIWLDFISLIIVLKERIRNPSFFVFFIYVNLSCSAQTKFFLVFFSAFLILNIPV